MNRFEFVLQAATAPKEQSLISLTAALMLAVEQTVNEEQDPRSDPAVMLLGAYIAFQLHADIASVYGHRALLGMCEDRLLKAKNLT